MYGVRAHADATQAHSSGALDKARDLQKRRQLPSHYRPKGPGVSHKVRHRLKCCTTNTVYSLTLYSAIALPLWTQRAVL